MANELTTWDPNSGAALPAYLADGFGGLGTNIPDRSNVPSLSYEGKTWSMVKNGNKTKFQAPNSDGDMVPIPVMRVVLLNLNADRGRAFYEGVYNPAAASAPKCWSPDGKAPDATVKDKQSALCQGCPQSVKGSKIQEGKEMVACSSHRMLAVAPAMEIAADPLRLKIAVTSDFDKEIVEHGWYALRQYLDFLKSRGIAHSAMVVTKIKFDSNVAYPKLLFAMDRLLTPDEVQQAIKAVNNPKVAELLSEKWTAAGTAGTPADESDMRPHGLEGAYADGWAAHPDAPGYSWKGSEVLLNADVAAKYPAPVAPPAPVEAASPPPVPASQQVIEHAPAPAKVESTASATGTVEVTPIVKPKPEDPAHIAHAGTEHEVWWDGAAWIKPWMTAAPEPVAPVIPAAPPAPPAAPIKTPRELALEAGWVQHPSSEPHGYLGSEVLDWPTIEAKFAGNGGASAATSGASGGSPSAATGAAPASVSSGTTATTAASPSDPASPAPVGDGAIPQDVAELLGKWAG